ncbi:MAG: outer membrane protein assembly factor BamD, partial [Burkholderiaceae bacterium]
MRTLWPYRIAHVAATLTMVAFAVSLGGCGWFGTNWGDRDETAKWDPDKLYSEARSELNNGGWKRSRELYQKLESRYPFGRHAQQALMEIAYTYYKE